MRVFRHALLGTLCLAAITVPVRAQPTQTSTAVAKATDYSIPAAPAFAFLDAGPATVHTPYVPRDFRIDWLLQDGQVASDLAIEAAPVWILGFGGVSAAEYRDLHPAVRTLSTLNVSVATTESGTQRTLAGAVKLTLYQKSDPVADADYTDELSRALQFTPAQTEAQNQLRDIVIDADNDASLTTQQKTAVRRLKDDATQVGDFDPSTVEAYDRLSVTAKNDLRTYLARLEEAHRALATITEATVEQLRAIRQQYERTHWNDARLDAAAGRLYRFGRTAGTGSLDSLSLVGTEWGGWLNGATGLGTQDWLVSGLARVLANDGDATYFVGGNVRYGGDDATLFVEYARRWGNRPPESLVSYGGSFSLSPQLNVQFGLRTTFDDDLRLDGLAPTIKLNGQTTDLLNALPL